jgi:hypothetical protein
MEYIGGDGDQNGIGMQKPNLHMILYLLKSLHFACLSFEIETEFEVGPLSKVVVLDEILEEVQRVGQV